MAYRLTIPARINILGNPADACEGDFATISSAVDVYAGALVEPSDDLSIDMLVRNGDGLETMRRMTFSPAAIPLPYDGQLDLVKAAINRLHRHSTEFRRKLSQHGVRIATWTDVPRQSGLGGSSLFVLLTLAGLRAFYELDPSAHNDYVLAELTQQVEARELGITCGFADRYVPLFGGIAYVDYRSKLHQRGLGHEPFATYERLDAWVDDLPLVAVSSGVQRDSGDVHGRMRPHYLEEHRAWMIRGGSPPPMVRFMTKAWETAWRGKIALLAGDWDAFGQLMNENHHAVNQMMAYCGFSDGAGWVSNLFIEAALASGALGAKLTGAGGGGSVFALTRPGEEEVLMAAWQKTTEEANLASARVYRLHVARRGLVVEVV
jgi:galactokinase/mevalonate kinase-like predicted kinase